MFGVTREVDVPDLVGSDRGGELSQAREPLLDRARRGPDLEEVELVASEPEAPLERRPRDPGVLGVAGVLLGRDLPEHEDAPGGRIARPFEEPHLAEERHRAAGEEALLALEVEG